MEILVEAKQQVPPQLEAIARSCGYSGAPKRSAPRPGYHEGGYGAQAQGGRGYSRPGYR